MKTEARNPYSLLIEQIQNQHRLLTDYNDFSCFSDFQEAFFNSIKEEASILFCNELRDYYKNKSCLEKIWITKLNVSLQDRHSDRFFNDDFSVLVGRVKELMDVAKNIPRRLERFIEIVHQELDLRCSQVLAYEETARRLKVVHYCFVPHLPMYEYAHKGGIIHRAFVQKKANNVSHCFLDPDYDIFDATVQSELAIPFEISPVQRGVVNFEDTHTGRFNEPLGKYLAGFVKAITQPK